MKESWKISVWALWLALGMLAGTQLVFAGEPVVGAPVAGGDDATPPAATLAAVPTNPATPTDLAAPAADHNVPLGEPTGLTRLSKEYDLWIDPKRKLVVVDGKVVLREGQLEMFACPKGTKEHESIVAVNSKAQFVHAALLAVGAVAGKPVQFDPKYVPASGTTIDITILWKDKDGNRQKARAQDWIKHVKTDKAMSYDWVFGGSGFWTDDTGRRYYYGDDGDFICVSNFGSAMLDLPVESTQANADLLFVAFTEKIPPQGTPVRLVLAPRLSKPAAKEAAPGKDAKAPASGIPADVPDSSTGNQEAKPGR